MRLINQQLQVASNFFEGEVMRNLLLDRHRRPITRVLNFCGDLARHLRRARAFFLGIFEYPQPLKPTTSNEIKQAREFRLGFPGKSNDESSAQRDAGNPSAQLVNQIFDVCARGFASHPSQHRIIDMLQRNIDVARDLVALCDGLNQLIAPMRRMRVKQANPEFAFDLLKFAKQYRESWSASGIDRLTRARFCRP